jgi:glycosyltransferase involved in cell wall biosynthesis
VEIRLSAIAGIPREKIVLIHDAVDPGLFKPKEEALHHAVLRTPYGVRDKVLVGIVGRVERQKEQLGFVRIAREVLNRTNKAVFFVIGEMKERSYCRQITKYLEYNGLSNHVHFTGRREDIGDVLADLDILVSLSGGSIRYEAMMCGITVVCAWSRRPEESYHVRHKETGFLVTAREVEPVTHVLLEAIERDDLRQRIGHNARLWAQQHLSHSVLVESTQALYDRLLAKRAAPTALVAQR